MQMETHHTLVLIIWLGLLNFQKKAQKFYLNAKIKIGNFDKTNSKIEKLLGVKFHHKLSFDDHILELCKMAGRKMHYEE